MESPSGCFIRAGRMPTICFLTGSSTTTPGQAPPAGTGRRSAQQRPHVASVCLSSSSCNLIRRPGGSRSSRLGRRLGRRLGAVRHQLRGGGTPTNPAKGSGGRRAVHVEAVRPGWRKQKQGYSRPGQHLFSFRVFRRYGSSCAVCGVSVLGLLDAAHLRPMQIGEATIHAMGSSSVRLITERLTRSCSASTQRRSFSSTAPTDLTPLILELRGPRSVTCPQGRTLSRWHGAGQGSTRSRRLGVTEWSDIEGLFTRLREFILRDAGKLTEQREGGNFAVVALVVAACDALGRRAGPSRLLGLRGGLVLRAVMQPKPRR